MTGLHGWVILDKPVGIGSTQCVSAVKRALREGGYGKHKVGHGGTLDPLASGVLPIAVGEATKLAGRMLDADKAYDFTIRFGSQTDTLDAEGVEVASSDVLPTMQAIQAILPQFTGPITQTPPAYSALKIDGERAYDRARAGEVFEIATREVIVHALEILPGTGRGTARSVVEGVLHPHGADHAAPSTASRSPSPSRGGLDEVTLSARVSKGTYIRSLARDIALALGTVGHVTMLRRTKAGPFTLEHSISLDNLAQSGKARALEDLFLPLTAGLDDIPALSVTPDQARALRQGRVLIGNPAAQGLHLAIEGEIPVALVEADGPEIRVVRGFNL